MDSPAYTTSEVVAAQRIEFAIADGVQPHEYLRKRSKFKKLERGRLEHWLVRYEWGLYSLGNGMHSWGNWTLWRFHSDEAFPVLNFPEAVQSLAHQLVCQQLQGLGYFADCGDAGYIHYPTNSVCASPGSFVYVNGRYKHVRGKQKMMNILQGIKHARIVP